MEHLVSSAIEYMAKGVHRYRVVTGHRHCDCIKQFEEMGLPKSMRVMSVERQGFMTDAGRFVDRLEACDIAIKSGQYKGERKQLLSEDVW